MDSIELAVDSESDAPFELSTAGTAAHTAVFAQTGAGKSFLLGRYLEEILLKTRAKVVILDPNSDFLKFALPLSLADDSFARAWRAVASTLLSNRDSSVVSPGGSETVNRIAIDWASLTPTEQCRYLGFTTALDYQEYVTVAIGHRVAKARNPQYTLTDFLALLRQIRWLLKERDANGGSIPGIEDDVDASLVPDQSLVKVFTEAFKLAELGIWPNGERTRSVEEVVGDFTSPESEQRLLILDLPSLEQDRAQAMLEDRTLELLWHRARENWLDAVMRPPEEDPRVPIFVVIDEAHNLAPPETSGAIEESVKARLTKIAAEGRKYGLFLVLVTQRPSRISYDILSQVENLFLLKLTNRIDLEFIQRSFGMLEPDAVTRAATLGLGQFILSGRLVPKPAVLKGLPRRTEEGGRSIRADVWIRAPELSRSA